MKGDGADQKTPTLRDRGHGGDFIGLLNCHAMAEAACHLSMPTRKLGALQFFQLNSLPRHSSDSANNQGTIECRTTSVLLKRGNDRIVHFPC